MVTPVRLELYDWKNNRHLLSIPLHSVRVQFVLSADGNLAVMDGQELRLFHTER
jgi:hypothetical protein